MNDLERKFQEGLRGGFLTGYFVGIFSAVAIILLFELSCK